MIKKETKDFVLRSMHKLNGIVLEIRDINSNMISLVIKKTKRNVAFIAFGEMAQKIKDSFPIKSRIKVRFYAVSKKFKERWYTDLVIYEVFEWKKNEKKIAQEQAQIKFIEEIEYIRPPKFEWKEELDKFNTASNTSDNE